MRFAILFFAAAVFAQDYTFVTWVDDVPPVFYRGHTYNLYVTPAVMQYWTVTGVDLTEHRFTIPSFPLTTSQEFRFFVLPQISGTLPDAVNIVHRYFRCETTSSFRVKNMFGSSVGDDEESDCSSSLSSGYIRLNTAGAGFAAGRRVSMGTGWLTILRYDTPPGVTLSEIWLNSGSTPGTRPEYGGGYEATGNSAVFHNIALTVAPDAPLGPATLNIVRTKYSNTDFGGFTAGQVIQTISLTLNIQDFTEVLPNTPASFAPLDSAVRTALLARWDRQGNSSDSAKRPCSETTGQIIDATPQTAASDTPLNASDATQIWFYEGHRFFREHARSVGTKPIFQTCAVNLASWYRDRVLANDAGLFDPFRRFSEGMARVAADVPSVDRIRFRQALLRNVVDTGTMTTRGTPGSTRFARDQSYAIINTINAAEACGASRWAEFKQWDYTRCGIDWTTRVRGLRRTVDSALTAATTFSSNPTANWQNFMAGLTSIGLARWYDFSWDTWGGGPMRRDPRVLAVLAQLDDHFWENYIIDSTNRIYTSRAPLGAHCGHSCQVSTTGPGTNTILIPLTALHRAAFLYYYTGEPRFQTRARTMLNWTVNGDAWGPHGKISSEAMSILDEALGFMLGHGRVIRHGTTL